MGLTMPAIDAVGGSGGLAPHPTGLPERRAEAAEASDHESPCRRLGNRIAVTEIADDREDAVLVNESRVGNSSANLDV